MTAAARRCTLRRLITALIAAVLLTAASGRAAAEPEAIPATLPQFVPHPSNWTPDYTVFPYNLWQTRVTAEQIDAEREACQWLNAQYGPLMSQVVALQRYLGDQHDNWATPAVQPAADIVAANLDQSGAFLDPRAHTLFITNYPDQSQYSPLFQGDSIYRLWFQLTQIRDKMRHQLPSGVINANIATATVYGNVITASGVCHDA
jgi:hypothetical protein